MKKVLLVSASTVFLKRNSSLLVGRGFELVTVKSGSEVLKIQEKDALDLVIADLNLEDMSGCTLCSLLGKEHAARQTPVILACYNISGSIERVRLCGASAMLLKPIDPIHLVETVSRFIDLQIGRSKRIELNVKVLSRNNGLEFHCYSHDISNTGILVESGHHFVAGSRIVCQFTLPDSFHIEIEGEVVRCLSELECDNLYGIKFIGLSMLYRRAIDIYVASIAHARKMNVSQLLASNSSITYV